MFNPISSKQAAFLGNLIAKTGKAKYLEVKAQLGLHGLLILDLTKAQAARLISELKREVGR